MIGDKWKVRKTCGDKDSPREVDPEETWQPSRFYIRRVRLQLFGTRVEQSCYHQDAQGHHSRYEKCDKGHLVLTTKGQYSGDNQWAEQRTGLIQRLVYAKGPSIAHLFGSMREHHITGRIARRLANALQDNEQSCHLPASG